MSGGDRDALSKKMASPGKAPGKTPTKAAKR
jgi:hypothetical protein